MVDESKLKQLKKKLVTFKKVSKVDSAKGVERAKEIIELINFILPDCVKENHKIVNNLNLTRDTLELYVYNLEKMDGLKNKWKN